MKRTWKQWRGRDILGILATVLADPTSSCATFPYIGQSVQKEILIVTHGTPADPCSAGGGGVIVSFLILCHSRVLHLSSSYGQVWSCGHNQGIALYNVSVGTNLIVDATSSRFLLIFNFPSLWNKFLSYIIFSDYGFPSFYSSQCPHHPSQPNLLLSDCHYKPGDF